MKYTTFGGTGLKVSKLGFGCMRLPYDGHKPDKKEAERILNIAFEKGVNYFDTAPLYCDNLSEDIVGSFIAGKRDKLILSTKDNGRTADSFIRSFERSFKRLKTDYIDVFHVWTLDLNAFKKVRAAEGLLDYLYKAKKDGRVRHLAFSFHDDKPENVKEIIDSGIFETVLLSYNMINPMNGKWLAYAHDKGMGTVIMNPVAGGNLTEPGDPAATSLKARIALKYAFTRPYVDIAISGMSSEAQVNENCATAAGDYAFTGEEEKAFNEIREAHKTLLELYCTGCNYCKGCKSGIDIPGVFGLYNKARVLGGWGFEMSRPEYAKLSVTADKCTACGACMKKCPQKLDIINNLKVCHKALT